MNNLTDEVKEFVEYFLDHDLVERGNDSEDFLSVHVNTIRGLIKTAYHQGRIDAIKEAIDANA